MTNDQIEKAIKKLEEFLYTKIDFEDFLKDLDLPLERGGAGWDRRVAERFALEIKNLIEQAEKISFTEKSKSAEELVEYLKLKLNLKLDDAKSKLFAGIILDRLENSIGKEEFEKLMDISEKQNGIGFDKRMASRIARELELLLLLRYSG